MSLHIGFHFLAPADHPSHILLEMTKPEGRVQAYLSLMWMTRPDKLPADQVKCPWPSRSCRAACHNEPQSPTSTECDSREQRGTRVR